MFIDVGTLNAGSSGDGDVIVHYNAQIMVGCGAPLFARVSFGGSISQLPDAAAGKNYKVATSAVQFSFSRGAIGFGGSDTPFHWTGHIDAYLLDSGNNVLDHETIPVDVKGKIHNNGGAANVDYYYSPTIYFSLKNGGVAVGNSRITNPSPGVVAPTAKTWNVVTSFPSYHMDDQGRVIDDAAPSSTVNGSPFSWGTGTNHYIVNAPTETGVPSWAPAGSAVVNDQDGNGWIVATTVPGFKAGIGGGDISALPDGTVRVWVFPTGNPVWGNNFVLPAGGTHKDFMPASDPVLPLDPCFSAAAADVGLSPPTIGTPSSSESNAVSPRPDIPLPTSPVFGTTSGSGSGGTSGGSSGGNGTGSTTTGVPGASVPSGASGSASGSGDSAANLPLPGDDDAKKLADDLARNFAKNTGDLQTAAAGVASWATFQPFNPGISGDWVVNIPVNGVTYAMTIPTSHAPTIRALLLFFTRVGFVVAVCKLIIS